MNTILRFVYPKGTQKKKIVSTSLWNFVKQVFRAKTGKGIIFREHSR